MLNSLPLSYVKLFSDLKCGLKAASIDVVVNIAVFEAVLFIITLLLIISGYAFAGASVKDYAKALYLADYLKHSNMRNESFSKDCIPLFEFYYNKIHLLKSETNAEKHCRLKTQDDYVKLMSDLKEIG